mgnify:FL=1
MANSIEDLMRADSQQLEIELPSSDKMSDLSDIIRQLERAQLELTQLEAKVTEQKKVVMKLSQVDIPELFREMGNLKSLELSDGRKVSVSEDFSLTIKKATEQEAFQWLRDNGKEEIIKKSFTLVFDKGEAEEAAKAAETLLANNLQFSEAEKVHPQTLKASLRGMIEKGITPPDSFTYYPYQKTVIK